MWPEEELVFGVTCVIVTAILKVYQVIVVMTCKYPMNPITNPNPRLSHCDTRDNTQYSCGVTRNLYYFTE
jgi:hypothetical protein